MSAKLDVLKGPKNLRIREIRKVTEQKILSARSGPKLSNPLPCSGPIGDSVVNHDCVHVEIDSAELWIKIQIQIESPHNTLDSEMVLKVDKEMESS